MIASDRHTITQRLIALGPALLLHLGFLFVFLHIGWSPHNGISVAEHEISLILRPTPLAPNWIGDSLPAFDKTGIALPHFVLPPSREYDVTGSSSEDPISDVSGVARTLFRCWPASLTGLPQTQEAQCLTLLPDESSRFLEGYEQSGNAAEWLRDRNRRNAPLRLPCVNGLSTAAIALAATAICVTNGLVNGFNLPSYAEDDAGSHMSGADTGRQEMQTVDPCALDKTYGFGFVCLYRVVNGNAPP